MEKAIYLAGGCFWGVERYYQLLEGILDTEVGYANGNFANPTYEDLKAHRASHVEAVKVVYDEEKIQLTQLLEHLFRIINPFTIDHQGGDYGHQYRTGIYYIEEEDKKIIQEFITNEQRKYKQKIRVEVEKLNHFYKAEDYHQNYLKKNPFGYCHVDFSVIKKEERKK